MWYWPATQHLLHHSFLRCFYPQLLLGLPSLSYCSNMGYVLWKQAECLQKIHFKVRKTQQLFISLYPYEKSGICIRHKHSYCCSNPQKVSSKRGTVIKIYGMLESNSLSDHWSQIRPAIVISCHDDRLWSPGFQQRVVVELWLMADSSHSFFSLPRCFFVVWCLSPAPGLFPLELSPQANPLIARVGLTQAGGKAQTMNHWIQRRIDARCWPQR